MQSVNTSNFTYNEAPIQASNIANPYTSAVPITGNQLPLHTLGTNYSTIRPGNLPVTNQASELRGNFPNQPQVIGARIVEPARQISTTTVGPSQVYVQPSQTRVISASIPTSQVYVNQVQRPVITSRVVDVRPVPVPPPVNIIPVNSVITHQRQVIQPVSQRLTETIAPARELPPEYQQTVQYEKYNEPLVQTVKSAGWDYSSKRIATPPPSAPAAKEKSCCNPILLALLGLLALAGLITAIILAAKAKGDYGTAAGGAESTPGIPASGETTTLQYPNYTVTIQTSIVNTTSTSSQTNNGTSTSTSTSQLTPNISYIYTNPVSVQPTISQPTYESSSQIYPENEDEYSQPYYPTQPTTVNPVLPNAQTAYPSYPTQSSTSTSPISSNPTSISPTQTEPSYQFYYNHQHLFRHKLTAH